MLEFLNNNAVLISMSMLVFVVLYIMLAIGWFFSTDYYDAYYDWYSDYEGPVVIGWLATIVLVIDVLIVSIMSAGFYALPHLFLSLMMWVVFVVPIVIMWVFKAREYLRKKRGKA